MEEEERRIWGFGAESSRKPLGLGVYKKIEQNLS